jgi:hypothetical protein
MVISWFHPPTWSRSRRRRMAAALASMALLATMGVVPAVRAAVPYSVGDVFAGVGQGQIMQFSPTGTLLNTLTGLPTGENTGMAFDAAGNLYGTGFDGNISKYDNSGNFLSSFGSGFTAHTESIVRDAAGNFYVGQATPGTPTVLKFDATGAPLGSFTVATEDRGSDWIDLAADQCTLFYTSEGVLVKRFNVCTNTQLPNFATLPSPSLFALRIRPNGDVMVAGTSAVYRLDSTGALVQTYTVPGTSYLFALNLDPDGASFWTADLYSGKIARVDIASGTVLTTFSAPPNPSVAGLAVFGEITAATAAISLTPATATNPAGTDHTVTAHVTSGGSPLPGQLVTFSVTGQNAGATGICVPASCITDASGNVTFTYHDTNGAGDDTITASFTDAAGALQSATAKKHWTAPTDQPINASGVAVAATEGTAFSGTVATFTDPDTAALASEYGATIDWGDGTSSTVGTISGSAGSFTVSGGHTYAEEGSFTVTVAITDTDNAANTATVTPTATVADAALTSACAMPSLTTQAFSGKTATFTDASSTGTLTDFTASINWGDSSSSAGTITGGPGTTLYTVSGSHTYASTGYFTVTTTITDVGGSTSTATCTKVLVFAFAPGGGAFAIGDKENTIGASVNFWGAQWAKNNPVSSGTVVSAFKGFVAKPTTPICGTTWSTNPGNSTPPPIGSLPTYMGVIVTSRYSQSGSLISGNTVHIVIVNTTNSGYDPGIYPNPGHPGTGKVVATVC